MRKVVKDKYVFELFHKRGWPDSPIWDLLTIQRFSIIYRPDPPFKNLYVRSDPFYATWRRVTVLVRRVVK